MNMPDKQEQQALIAACERLITIEGRNKSDAGSAVPVVHEQGRASGLLQGRARAQTDIVYKLRPARASASRSSQQVDMTNPPYERCFSCGQDCLLHETDGGSCYGKVTSIDTDYEGDEVHSCENPQHRDQLR